MWDKKLCIIGLGCLLQVLNASSDENVFWDIWSKRRNDAPLREDISSERGEGEDYSEKSEVTISSDGLSDEPENDKESTDREEIYDGEENPKKDNVLIIKAKEKLKFWQSEINEINSRIDLMSRYECSEDLKELNKKRLQRKEQLVFGRIL